MVGCKGIKDDQTKSRRNSSLELLRILAMLVIVVSHFGVHGVIVRYPFSEELLTTSMRGGNTI